jgi:hypothetical protein
MNRIRALIDRFFARARRTIHRLTHPYRPERHYMRGGRS